MKKYLGLLAYCVALQVGAEQVLLERAEYLSFDPGVKTVFTQRYDKQTQQLEVLSESEGEESHRYKRVVQYDNSGERIIRWEEFRWDNTAQQWQKNTKGQVDFTGNKTTYTDYQNQNNEWVAYRKQEELKDEQSHTQVTYELSPEQQWVPLNKSYTLLKSDQQTPAVVEEYDWDQQQSQWRLNNKIEYTYDQNNEISQQQSFSGEDGKWVSNIKITYQRDPNGNSAFTQWSWENGQWQEQERSITEQDKAKRQSSSTSMLWDAQQGGWKNMNRGEFRYTENEQTLSTNFFKWDENTQQWQTISETTYDYDEQGRVHKQQDFYSDQEGRQITYQYDQAGNTVEELIQQYDFSAKTWHKDEKIRYSYDPVLRRQDVLDKDNIADEELVPAVNALIKKEVYRLENQNFILKEQVNFFYTNFPKATDRTLKEVK